MRLPDSEQAWRYGSTLGALVSAAGLLASLGGIGVPGWVLWLGPLLVCAGIAIRLWPEHIERADARRHAVPARQAFVDPRESSQPDV